MTIEQTLGQLPGVLVGGGVTGLVTWATRRAQRGDTLAAESRAREHAATSRLAETVAKLRALDRPDEVIADSHDEYLKEMDARWAAWRRARAELVLFFQIAALDVKDAELRDDLESCALLMHGSGPSSASWDETPDAYEAEGRVRYGVCRFAMSAIGEYRRGDPVMPPGGWLGNELDRIQGHPGRQLVRLRNYEQGRRQRRWRSWLPWLEWRWRRVERPVQASPDS